MDRSVRQEEDQDLDERDEDGQSDLKRERFKTADVDVVEDECKRRVGRRIRLAREPALPDVGDRRLNNEREDDHERKKVSTKPQGTLLKEERTEVPHDETDDRIAWPTGPITFCNRAFAAWPFFQQCKPWKSAGCVNPSSAHGQTVVTVVLERNDPGQTVGDDYRDQKALKSSQNRVFSILYSQSSL
jgi:hypothetical protein